MRRFLGILCVLLAVADLTRYFRQVCTHDRRSRRIMSTPPARSPATSAACFGDRSLPPTRPSAFDAGVVDNAPIRNLFWPVNVYLVPKVRLDPTGTITLPAFDPVSTPAIGFAESLDGDVTGAGRILRWTWNDFELDATTPASGWIHVPQLHDRCWRANVDGERVKVEPTRNGVGMAIPVASGTHRITLEYRPLARSLYGPATWLTFGSSSFRSRSPGEPSRVSGGVLPSDHKLNRGLEEPPRLTPLGSPRAARRYPMRIAIPFVLVLFAQAGAYREIPVTDKNAVAAADFAIETRRRPRRSHSRRS